MTNSSNIKGWISEQEKIMLQKFFKRKKRFEYLLLFNPEVFLITNQRREQREKIFPRTYFAYIVVGKTKFLSKVTPDEKTAYKLDHYSNTYMPWKKFIFTRWCSGMDL